MEVEVRLFLNNSIIKMLEDWQEKQKKYFQSRIEEEADEKIKHALATHCETLEVADFDLLTRMYLSYQVIEGRYKK